MKPATRIAAPAEAPAPRNPRWIGAVAGVIAAAVALGAGELVAALLGGDASPVVVVGGGIVDAAPQWLKAFAIRTFGANDKVVLIGGILVVLVVIAALLGGQALRRLRPAAIVVAALGIAGAVFAARRPAAAPLDVLPSLVAAAAGIGALALLARAASPSPQRGQAQPASAMAPAAPTAAGAEEPDEPSAPPAHGKPFLRPHPVESSRRGFLRTGLLLTGAAAVSGGAGRAIAAARGNVSASRAAVQLPVPASPAPPLPAGADLKLPGLSSFYTPNKDFYRVDTSLVVPRVPAETWTLKVGGMVDRPLEIDFQQLLRRPMIERDLTLSCVSNEVGGPYVGTARWIGAPLKDLLEEAGVRRGADQLVSRADDGFTIGTPMAAVLDGRDAILAVGMNGQPLPLEHGFPVRMIVPGLFGYVSATKWLVELEASTFAAFDAYWVKRKWAREGPVKTMTRIDTPKGLSSPKRGRVAVAGVTWAQHTGIEKVEVRVDGGAWAQARLAPAPSADTWRQWVWEWDAQPGQHTLEARGTDRSGRTQTESRAAPFPSGATGWHSVVVTVT
jgi:DMSO/TMAO reductase YedYZ molybdopterin-dependent catalytic subunit